MKVISGVLVVFVLLWALLECYYIYSRITVLSCSGLYRSENWRDSHGVKNISNILITVRKSKDIEVDITGTLVVSDSAYNINREYVFNYRPQNINTGIIKIRLNKMIKNSTDRVKEYDDGKVFPALQGKDGLIRIWKISPEVVLVGNVFTPIFSCTQNY